MIMLKIHNKKLKALARATPSMKTERMKHFYLIFFFFSLQFNYCPPILMLHSRRNKNIVKHLHERCLRLIYNDKLSC